MPKKTNCLYSQVADALIAQINGHMYGKLLPSERALCEQYQVSRTTIRQALHLLAQRGYVDGVRGKGMVVSHPQLLQELHSVYNFHEEMRRQGKRRKRTWLILWCRLQAAGWPPCSLCRRAAPYTE